MKPFSNSEWYPILVRGENLIFVGDWVLHCRSPDRIEMLHCNSGEMCRAVVEDGRGFVRADLDYPDSLEIPQEVLAELAHLLGLTRKDAANV